MNISKTINNISLTNQFFHMWVLSKDRFNGSIYELNLRFQIGHFENGLMQFVILQLRSKKVQNHAFQVAINISRCFGYARFVGARNTTKINLFKPQKTLHTIPPRKPQSILYKSKEVQKIQTGSFGGKIPIWRPQKNGF